MKSIILLMSLILITSCREEVDSWDKLSAAERAIILARASQECLSSSKANFNRFQEESDDEFNSLSRNDSWNLVHKKKEGTTDTTIETSTLHVWKKTTNNLYLIWVDKSAANGGAVNTFIKITDVTNEEMIEDLKNKKCLDKTNFKISDSSSSATIQLPTTTTLSGNNKIKDTFSYSFKYKQLAWFGMTRPNLTRKTYDKNDKLTKTETYYTLPSVVSNPATLPTNYLSYTSANYCVMKFSAPVLPSVDNSYFFPYRNGLGMVCTTDPNIGPDADGDAAIDFDPASELPYP